MKDVNARLSPRSCVKKWQWQLCNFHAFLCQRKQTLYNNANNSLLVSVSFINANYTRIESTVTTFLPNYNPLCIIILEHLIIDLLVGLWTPTPANRIEKVFYDKVSSAISTRFLESSRPNPSKLTNRSVNRPLIGGNRPITQESTIWNR
jgi:hypothetical protein